MAPTPRSPRRRATIMDVARAADVSRQTVSNVVNNPDRVRRETRDRVRAEIERLDYRPNSAARSMRAQRAGAVGVELNAAHATGSDVAQQFLTELILAAPRFDAHVVPFAHPERFPAVDGYQEMVRRRLVDAFVFSDTHPGDARPGWLTAAGIPFATFGRIYGRPDLTSWADVDGHAGTGAAVRHLLDQGYASVGYLGWPTPDADAVVARSRRDGWADALAAAGRPIGPEGTCDQDLGSATAAARLLLERLAPGDAVVCASDLLAVGVLYAAVERGWTPGPDLGVVGFDGSAHARRHGLTTVAQPLAELSAYLLGLVHEQLAGGPPPPEGRLLTPTLHRAASTDRSAAGSTIPLPGPGNRR